MSGDARDVRSALADERAQTLARLAAAEADFDRIVEAGREVSTDDEHDPDGVGLAVERAHIIALREHARAQLERLDATEDRLARGEYGRCEACGRPIPPERLAARPTAATCVGCAARPGR